MKLSEFREKGGIIKKLPRDDATAARLADMGYHEGMRTDFILSGSNLGEYRIGETLLGLRMSECDKILVIKTDMS